ncbi:MAG: Rrf2 family transcriptional regulator [Burkholderiales bacterium]
MRLTTFTDYSLRVLMYLALDRPRLATIPEIAHAFGVSENHLVKVVHRLAQAGVIASVRGKGGGVRLARPPERIRIGEIVRMTEGDAPIVECFSDDNGCRIAGPCRLRRALFDGFEALYASLDRHTLADIAGNRRALAGALHRAA